MRTTTLILLALAVVVFMLLNISPVQSKELDILENNQRERRAAKRKSGGKSSGQKNKGRKDKRKCGKGKKCNRSHKNKVQQGRNGKKSERKCRKGKNCNRSRNKKKGGHGKKMKNVAKKNLKRKNYRKIENNGRAPLKGDSCEYIDLAKIMSVDGCETGKKFVIGRASKKIRRQYLIVEGKTILAFVSSGTKFTACSSTKDITSSISCKTVDNLSSFSLSSNSSSSDSNSTSSEEATTPSNSSSNTNTTDSPSGNTTTSGNSSVSGNSSSDSSSNSSSTLTNKTITGRSVSEANIISEILPDNDIDLDVDNDIEEDDISKEVDGDYIEEVEESYDANSLEPGQRNTEVEIIQ